MFSSHWDVLRRQCCTTSSAESYNCSVTRVSHIQVTLQVLQCWKRLSYFLYNRLLTFQIQMGIFEYSNKAVFSLSENFKRVCIKGKAYLCRLHRYTMKTNRTCWVTEDKAPAAYWDKVILHNKSRWTVWLHVDKHMHTHCAQRNYHF